MGETKDGTPFRTRRGTPFARDSKGLTTQMAVFPCSPKRNQIDRDDRVRDSPMQSTPKVKTDGSSANTSVSLIEPRSKNYSTMMLSETVDDTKGKDNSSYQKDDVSESKSSSRSSSFYKMLSLSYNIPKARDTHADVVDGIVSKEGIVRSVELRSPEEENDEVEAANSSDFQVVEKTIKDLILQVVKSLDEQGSESAVVDERETWPGNLKNVNGIQKSFAQSVTQNEHKQNLSFLKEPKNRNSEPCINSDSIVPEVSSEAPEDCLESQSFSQSSDDGRSMFLRYVSGLNVNLKKRNERMYEEHLAVKAFLSTNTDEAHLQCSEE